MFRVDRLGSVDIFLTNVRNKLTPNRFHCINPCLALFCCQFTNCGARVQNSLACLCVCVAAFCVVFNGDLLNDCAQLCAHVFWQTVPEINRCHQHVIDQTVVCFCDAVLDFKEFLGVDV